MQIVHLKSSDGLQLSGLYSKAENSEKIIIHIHGMAGSVISNEFYLEMHNEYPKLGYSFLCSEHRGTGCITQYNNDISTLNQGNAFEIFEECIFDIQGMIDWANSQGYTKIYLSGHSYGCSKIIYYLNQVLANHIAGIILLSPPDMYNYKNFEPEYKWYIENKEMITKMIAQGKGEDIIKVSFMPDYQIYMSANAYTSTCDSLNNNIFHYAQANLESEMLRCITIPVIVFGGTKDDAMTVTTNGNAQIAIDYLDSNLTNSTKYKSILLQGADHSFDDFGQEIVTSVIDFIKDI